MYSSLLEPAANLNPDDAFFVTSLQILAGGRDATDAVNALRRGLHHVFRPYKLVFLSDTRRRGVWVYRPSMWAGGNGKAIGPTKEQEVMSRPLE